MVMKALVVGGTGLVSTAIVRELAARGVHVSVFNRGLRSSSESGVRLIRGDRDNVSDFVQAFERERFDVVYDMICYTPDHAAASARAFAGRCEQFVLCSSAVVYGVGRIPPGVLVDEQAPLEPTSYWGKSKVLCEQTLADAASGGAFKLTIARLGHTYGPGDAMNDQQDNDGLAWDRVVRGLPVFCAGDGLGLWQSTHRDDAAKFFAGAAMAPQTYGQTFNVIRDEVLTWRDYYREVARALDTRARLIFVPAAWLIAQDPERFSFLRELSQFHAAYSSAKARAAVPEFRATIGLEAGARETFADMRRRGAWPDSASDAAYQGMVDRALALGFPLEEA
ncbi:MAG: NAD-dependent epimerase/dehydratase family protein [Polyangiaceae bacterium]